MSYFDDASLVMIPSGYKNAKVYSVKPTDGTGDLTFTRASSATRVASNGLIEKVRTNLVLQSQTFDNASWTKTTDGQVTITANAAVAPDGTTTAEKMIPSAIAGFHCVAQTITLSASETSVSIFAKAAEYSFLQIFDSLTTEFANFNLTTGVVGSTNTYVASIESVGNGWYRCKATKAAPSGSFTLRYGVVTSASAVRGESFTGNGTDGLLIWGAQAETGVTTDYIATTTAAVSVGPVSGLPRLDYYDSTCPKILLEPSRTNVWLFSEQVDNAAWTKLNLTISANVATSPAGFLDADKVIANSGANLSSISNTAEQTISKAASALAFTYSVFAKESGLNRLTILAQSASIDNRATVTFSLNNGSIVSAATSFGSFSAASATATDYGNGWYRLTLSFTTDTAVTLRTRNIPTDSTITTGDGVAGILIYGATLEQASYATSYIPTLGTSVTRVADAASKTGISSLIGQTEGTLFIDVVPTDLSSLARYISIEASAGVGSGWIGIFASGSNTFRFFGDGWSFSGGVQVRGTRYKVAMAYKNGVLTSAYVNGTSVGTLTANTTGKSYANLKLANASIGNFGCSDFFQSIIFPTALTNAQLAELTA
jgi:hypothetical protein